MKEILPDLLTQLKGYPNGTTLFSHIFGYVTLEDIVNDGDIVVKRSDGRTEIFNRKGQYYYDEQTNSVSPCQLLELSFN